MLTPPSPAASWSWLRIRSAARWMFAPARLLLADENEVLSLLTAKGDVRVAQKVGVAMFLDPRADVGVVVNDPVERLTLQPFVRPPDGHEGV